MWRQALDRERPADPHPLVVLVGLVVERLGVGVAHDRPVDLFAGHALPDVGVVGDRLEHDVRHAPVDEALADVALGPVVGRCAAGQLGFLADAFLRVGEEVVGVLRRHQAGARQRQRDTRGVDRDPATTPLLGDVGGGAGAAGWVEDEVTGIGGHEQTTLDDFCCCLYHVDLSADKSSFTKPPP